MCLVTGSEIKEPPYITRQSSTYGAVCVVEFKQNCWFQYIGNETEGRMFLAYTWLIIHQRCQATDCNETIIQTVVTVAFAFASFHNTLA